MTSKQSYIYLCFLSTLASLFLIYVNAERKVAQNNCQCGVQTDFRRNAKYPWIVFVHVTDALSNKTKTCTGTIIASNVIGTSNKCLANPETGTMINKSEITVTEDFRGRGISFPVLDILRKPSRQRYFGILVDYNFTEKESKWKPVCIPDDCEFTSSSLLSFPASYVSPTGKIIKNLLVRKVEQCDRTGMFGKGNNFLCLTILGNTTRLEEGQPVFVHVVKNEFIPVEYVYLAGVSMLTFEDGLEKNIFFLHINSFMSVIDFITNGSSTEWCSQPWPWLRSPEKVKRDESIDCECGLLRNTQQGRIVGGVEATPYEFPWIVRIDIIDPPDKLGDNFCGGSMISDRVILTAAHCVAFPPLQGDKRVGYDVFSPERKYFIKIRTHKKFEDPQSILLNATFFPIIHPGYVDGVRIGIDRVMYDEGLLILSEPLNFTATDSDGRLLYRPVCLPKQNERIEVVGREVLAAGWGLIHNNREINDTSASELRKINLNVLPLQKCRDFHQSIPLHPLFAQTTFCLSLDWMHTVYHGDSGSPIVINQGNGKHYQVGTVSFGHPEYNRRRVQIGTSAYSSDLQRLLPFIEYYSNKYGAKYCKK